jgi:hypothetical protein
MQQSAGDLGWLDLSWHCHLSRTQPHIAGVASSTFYLDNASLPQPCAMLTMKFQDSHQLFYCLPYLNSARLPKTEHPQPAERDRLREHGIQELRDVDNSTPGHAPSSQLSPFGNKSSVPSEKLDFLAPPKALGS